MLAQKLPKQDNQPRIFDGPGRARNISNLCRCFAVMSDRMAIPPFFNRLSIGKAFFRATLAPRDRPSIVPVTRHGILSHGQDHHRVDSCPRRLQRCSPDRPLQLRHVPTCLPRPSCFSVRLERRFCVPACNLTERWSPRRSREARSRAEPRAAASSRRAWRALDLDGRCTRRNARSG